MPGLRSGHRFSGAPPLAKVHGFRFALIAVARLGAGGRLTIADPPAAIPAGPITPEMRAEDPRLARKVTVSEPGICLGELLDRLSEQAHIPLSGPADEVSGEPVTVFVKDLPLSDVLQGLYYLFSYRGAEWEWQRTGSAGTFAYHFQPTKAALRFAASIRGEMQNALEYQVEEMIAARGRSDDDLKKDPRL